MKLTLVRCQGCGAGLKINEMVRYVTCNYCNAQLEVVHEPTVTHTKLLEAVAQTTERLTTQVRIVELENELLKLEREWDQLRERSLPRDGHGKQVEPSTLTAKAIALFTVILIPLLTFANSRTMDWGSALLISGVLVAVAFFAVKGTLIHAREFERTRAAYLRRRSELKAALIEQHRRLAVLAPE
jgi:DNA-directed RNA polymerase subunit RPC12/RpoP